MKESDSLGAGFCNVLQLSGESRSKVREELEGPDCSSLNASSLLYEFEVLWKAAISRARSIASSHS